MSIFDEIPDVSFIGDLSLAQLKEMAVKEYKAAYKAETGKELVLDDKDKAKLYSQCQILYQLAESINNRARQNLLKYSTGDYLANLANSRLIERKQSECAVVKIRFTLSAVRETPTAIPAGTRITSAAGQIYFATDEYAEIPPGETYIDVQSTSTVGGNETNKFTVGELNVLVDPIAYIATVSNTEVPSGGADVEDDDTLRDRIYESRNLYSTTGAENTYKARVKEYSTSIDDVEVQNPYDSEIYIYILMDDRELATDSFISGLTEYMYDDDTKPLTDRITIQNVERVEYKISVEYKICDSDISRLTAIQSQIAAAVEKYKTWQSEKIGRNVDSQELLSLLRIAGARDIVISEPQTAVVEKHQIAYCTEVAVIYNGTIEE